jgi:hypothetical protein
LKEMRGEGSKIFRSRVLNKMAKSRVVKKGQELGGKQDCQEQR